MLGKWMRLYHTIKYIKGIQLFYQIWYRIKNRVISIHWYNGNFNNQFRPLTTCVDKILFTRQQEMLAEKKFRFIGLTHTFEDRIDWNFSEYGKLWNYNLQYFSFLLDESLTKESRQSLLKSFSHALVDKKVALEPYPVSLRIVNSLLFHARHPIKDTTVLNTLLKQVDYLSNNLEFHLLGNHLLENAFSLYIASIYLNNIKLYRLSYKLLEKELHEQVLADGGHYECTPMYQSILLAKLFLCIELARQSTMANSDELALLEKKAAKMLGWINEYSFPDGSWALMNDAAEDIAPSTASLNEAAASLQIIPDSIHLSESGFRKLAGTDWQLLIKTGPVQPSYQPGHVHADIMSFCLWYKGKQVIVDPGTSTYAISEQRTKERSTICHNTLSINGHNQSDVWGGFRVGKRASVFLQKDLPDHIEVHLKPYFDFQVKHIRQFIKLNDRQFKIEDEILSGTSTKFNITGGVQFGAGIPIEHMDHVIKSEGLHLEFSKTNKPQPVAGTYASSYNELKNATRIIYEMNASGSLIFNFT